MDPLTAASLAANVVQFIDFTSKLISQGYEIYKSATGATQENTDIEQLTTNLQAHLKELRSPGQITVQTYEEQSIEAIASRCDGMGQVILQDLAKLKVDGKTKYKRLSSISKALQGLWGRKELQDKVKRLEQFRNQLQFIITNSLRYVPLYYCIVYHQVDQKLGLSDPPITSRPFHASLCKR